MARVKLRYTKSGRKPKRILILSALIIPVLIVALYVIFYGIERKEYIEKRGEMSEDFVKLPTVEYDGRLYAQKLNMTTLLLMGVDRQEGAASVGYRDGGQADFLMLLIVDHDAKTIRQLQIDRDTMTQVVVLGVLGNEVGTREMQICLSHAYGKDTAACGEYALKAVSNLLEGIVIDGCLSLDMSGIGALNAALGGVRVTLDEELTALDPAMEKGKTLTLSDAQAEILVRARQEAGDGTNAARMARQRVYLATAVDQLFSKCRADASFAESFLTQMQTEGMYSSLSTGRLVNEAGRALKYEVQPIETLTGQHSIGADGFMEFHADQEALIAWVMGAFFREKE